MNSLKKEKMNLKMKTKKLTIAFEDKNLLIVKLIPAPATP